MSMNKFYSVSFDETNKEFSVRTFADDGYYQVVYLYKSQNFPKWQIDDAPNPPVKGKAKATELGKKWVANLLGDLKHSYRVYKVKDKDGMSDDEYNKKMDKLLKSLEGK